MHANFILNECKQVVIMYENQENPDYDKINYEKNKMVEIEKQIVELL